MAYKIVPLNAGDLQDVPKQTCMYRMYREVTYKAPCIMWYIQGTRDNVIVDLAPPDPKTCLKRYDAVIERSEKQEPVNALNAAGLSPDDVKTVIITHLHWDHTYGFDTFKNATFLIQRKEMQYAIAPLPCHRWLYHGKSPAELEVAEHLHRVRVIDGDHQVEEGVNCIHIPSHTPGFQGVSIKTEKGDYFIAGDAVGLFECWERTPHVPSGIFNNLEQYYRSMERIERISDFVLPGHDGKVFEKAAYP